MDLVGIRKVIVTAIASDQELAMLLVFKGGNALDMIHNIGNRSSLDLDFSMELDVPDHRAIATRLYSTLTAHFERLGLVLFDWTFAPRPSERPPGARWGGYTAEFKLIPRDIYDAHAKDIEKIRRQATEAGPGHLRRFKLEISPFEYCEGKIRVQLDGISVFVYSIEMIAVEKLRAICQQDPSFLLRIHPAPRARDFYDIHAAVTEGGVDFSSPAIHGLIQRIFAAKAVPLSLIRHIHEQREFHRADWPSVQNAVAVKLRQFDYYFEFVLGETEKLQPLWIE